MIITDDAPDSPSKAQRVLPNLQNGNDIAPPPAYTGPSSYPSAVPFNASTSPSDSLLVPLVEREPVERASSRFIKAFGVAVLIYVCLGVFTGSTIGAAYHNSPRRGGVDQAGWPLQSDGKIRRCVSGHKAWARQQIAGNPSASFELPLSADVMYLFARGALSRGNVVIIQDETWREPDTVKVDVSLKYATREIMEATSVCLLERQEGHSGVGIFSPLSWHHMPYPKFKFDVTVRLPMSPNIHPVQIAAFETSLPMFSQYLGDVEHEISFGSLRLESRNAGITVKSVYADNCTIRTSSGAIEGNFYASDSLNLETKNGHIQARVSLFHDTVKTTRTGLTMRTTNGAIMSDIHLISPAPSNAGGTFDVVADTTNGQVVLDFPQSAVDAYLDVDARTTNAAATVSMNPAFEGAFQLYTTNANLEVPFDAHARDPAGRGRRRKMSMARKDKYVDGVVSWGNGGESKGFASLRSTNGPVTLGLK